MVKADLARDYYADLELQSGASEAEIRKQFRKLALKYHPDRNPGREAEVNVKFQTINTAHEVLTDVEQKAKYDSQRARNSSSRSYATYGGSTTTASGTRGNPWSSAGSQWAPPPKPPPSRKPPPASAGAQRYANFANYATPNSTPPKPNADAEARRKNWEAWESMKPPTRPWQPPKPIPKEYTPQSGREESNNTKHPPPPKSNRPGYEEFRAGTSTHSERTSPSRPPMSNQPPRRNGFMPATPGGDEPQASNTSAYSTYRPARTPNEQKSAAPQVPPRHAPPPDPLRHFREKSGTPYEPRLSTPYATHGGEKTNPFESINLNRSKSTRGPSDRAEQPGINPSRKTGPSERHRSASPPGARFRRHLSPEPNINRAESDVNLSGSPKRTFSHANRSSKPNEPLKANNKPNVEDNTSSDGDDSDSDIRQQSFGTRSRTFAKRRTAQTAGHAQEASASLGRPDNGIGTYIDEHLPRPGLAAFREWWRISGEAKRDMLNDLPPDGQPSGYNTANRSSSSKKQDEPSMYADFQHFNISSPSARRQASIPPTSTEELHFPFSKFRLAPEFSSFPFGEVMKQRSGITQSKLINSPPHAPSGEPYQSTPLDRLTPFEVAQFKLVDELITRSNKNKKLTEPSCGSTPTANAGIRDITDECGVKPQIHRAVPTVQGAQSSFNIPNANNKLPACATYRSSGEMGSPFKKHKINHVSHFASSRQGSNSRLFTECSSNSANSTSSTSFSFTVDSKTFKSPGPTQTAFTSSSTEKISTTFTPEDWHGKFEAGDYFASDKNGVNRASRARSGDRVRTKSPIKGRPTTRSQTNLGDYITSRSKIETEAHQQTTDSETPISPSGTKFTAEEWARTFSPQVFAPPPYPSGATARPSSRPRRTRTGSSTPRVPHLHKTAGTAAMAAESSSEDSLLEMGSRRAQAKANSEAMQNTMPVTTDSPNAMDIDPPLDRPETSKPSREDGASGKESSSEARNVPLEPSRPDWRSGDKNGANTSIPSMTSEKPDVSQRPAEGKAFRRRPTKSWDEDDFKTTLEDLKNVEPLHHPATGLHSFADLTSNLPFPSQAASKLTIPHDFSSGELALPHPPRAPMVPRIPEGAIRPMPSSWESYLQAFKAYMADWDIFNTQIIMHFVARRNQLDGMKSGWLEAFGNSDLDKYKEGLKEDRKVREWWAVACEKHEAGMEQFQWVKNCLKDGLAAANAAAGK